VESGNLEASASERLPFRELGLSIGLRGMAMIWGSKDASSFNAAGNLETYLRIATRIEETWLDPMNQRQRSWVDHEDINTVMLTTCLLPDRMVRLE